MPTAYQRHVGLFWALVPGPFAVLGALWARVAVVPSWSLALAVVASLGIVASAVLLTRDSSSARIVVVLTMATALVLALPMLRSSPFVTLSSLLGATAVAGSLWLGDAPLLGRATPRSPLGQRTRGAALGVLVLWLVVLLRGRPSFLELAALALSESVLAVLGLQWLLHTRDRRMRRAIFALTLLGGAVIATTGWSNPSSGLAGGAVAAFGALLVVPARISTSQVQDGGWWEPLVGHPQRLLVGTFALLCALGTLLLVLPQTTAAGVSIGFVDALFTAVSAVCVTGLVVRDTPVVFNSLGLVAILLLIQLGGLGIMTFSTAALRMLGRRMSIKHEGAVANLLTPGDRGRLFAATRNVLLLTFGTELLGAALLGALFLREGDSLAQAAWRGLFTAVSAFCNAGFALQSDNLISYAASPLVLHTVGLLIILGGLSPGVVASLPWLLRRPKRLGLQPKLVLLTTAVLLVGGFLLILATEGGNTLANMSLADKLHNAWFQSVTLRTAGFNSIDIAAVRPATQSVMMFLMFVGGGPGGTAGGIKVTTLCILVLMVVNAVRGHWGVTVFGRRVGERALYKATVIATLAVGGCILAILAILLTQDIAPVSATFEVISALGTVGLSMGATLQLDGVGKIIIVACMFVGRVGTLTFFMFLSQRLARRGIVRPEEEVEVG